jgi:hypothetical protein
LLQRVSIVYIEIYMKRILVELDDACARDLERVAPSKKRLRAEFIRLAVRRAVDLALDRATQDAYRKAPLDAGPSAADVSGWDENNQLAMPARSRTARRRGAA